MPEREQGCFSFLLSQNCKTRHDTEKSLKDRNPDYVCQVKKQPHTQVPNLVSDVVYPLLSGSQMACLHYIIRRTYGYTDGQGGRKARDTITRNQFTEGIETKGGPILDLGTGLSKKTVMSALDKLEEKGLVISKGSCTACFWEESGESQGSDGRKCPRCHASLSASYAVAELTPNLLLRFINEDEDSQKVLSGRQFVWNSDVQRFSLEKDMIKEKAKEKADQSELDALMDQLWHPDLVRQVIAAASGKNKSGKIAISSRIRNYVAPVLELQKKYESPVVKYAIEQTLKGPVFRGDKRPVNWVNYAKAVASNTKTRQVNAKTDDPSKEAVTKLNRLLREAAKQNGTGDREAARKTLTEALALAPDVAGKADGEDKARELILLSFKQGTSDFLSAEEDPYAPDFS